MNTNGLVTAVGEGSATITASVGLMASTNSVTLTVGPVVPGLAHRYSFASNTANDSVGTANGTLNGTAAISGGTLNLDGTQGSSVTLPAGILSNVDEVTIETWATFPGAINAWANLFAFGYTDLTPLDPNINLGGNYITFQPHTGNTTVQMTFAQGLPGFNGERDASIPGVLDNQSGVHVVVVYHPLAGYEAFYTNGVLAAQNSMFNTLIDPVGAQTPAFNGHSILAYTLGADLNNYIGQSLYTGDPGLLANISEFRIYTNALTAAQIAATQALGPNQLLGTSVNTTLSASAAGGNVTVKWPTTSALVTLLSSPTLGASAVWTPVAAPLTVVSGNYQVTLPATGTLFFRLEQ